MFPELLPHSQISNELWFKELNIQEQGCIFDPLFSLAACVRFWPLIGPQHSLITSKCLLPPGHFLSGIFSRTPGQADGSWLRCPGVASDGDGARVGERRGPGRTLLTSDNGTGDQSDSREAVLPWAGLSRAQCESYSSAIYREKFH